MSDPDSKGFRWRGQFGLALLVPAVALALVSEPVVGEQTLGNVVTDLLAWLSFATGAALRFWATLYVGDRKGQVVVSDGPYSLCRNPLYVGSLLIGLSVPLFLKSVIILMALGCVAVLYVVLTIPAEERELARLHGAVYLAYRAQTPRFLPTVRQIRTAPHIDVSVRALYREARKARGWVMLPITAELIAHLRHAPWWPHLWRLP